MSTICKRGLSSIGFVIIIACQLFFLRFIPKHPKFIHSIYPTHLINKSFNQLIYKKTYYCLGSEAVGSVLLNRGVTRSTRRGFLQHYFLGCYPKSTDHGHQPAGEFCCALNIAITNFLLTFLALNIKFINQQGSTKQINL